MIRHLLQSDFFAGAVPPTAASLAEWRPREWSVAADWRPTVDAFWDSRAGQDLGQFVSARLAADATVYPPQPLRALELTPLSTVRVVIVGQDPYHGPGQAEGLAFSVAPGMAVPPSLRNIFKELGRDPLLLAPGCASAPSPANGSLVHWAHQGVLLLNTCLTVERGQPASHANRGWEVLADAIVKSVINTNRPVVFMLWGNQAQKMATHIVGAHSQHLVLTSNHPSPLSALRLPQPFIGCGHFSHANAFLLKSGETPVKWRTEYC